MNFVCQATALGFGGAATGEKKSMALTSAEKKTAAEIVAMLDLQRHPDGGFYLETFRDPSISLPKSALPPRYKVDRSVSSAIYFLLPAGEIAKLHRIPCAETWHYYMGEPLTVFEVHDDGHIKMTVVGPDLRHGQRPQYTVPPNVWFGAFLTHDIESFTEDGRVFVKTPGRDSELHYSFVGVTCAPAFQFEDNEMATQETMKAIAPKAEAFINYLFLQAVSVFFFEATCLSPASVFSQMSKLIPLYCCWHSAPPRVVHARATRGENPSAPPTSLPLRRAAAGARHRKAARHAGRAAVGRKSGSNLGLRRGGQRSEASKEAASGCSGAGGRGSDAGVNGSGFPALGSGAAGRRLARPDAAVKAVRGGATGRGGGRAARVGREGWRPEWWVRRIWPKLLMGGRSPLVHPRDQFFFFTVFLLDIALNFFCYFSFLFYYYRFYWSPS
uniref:DUF985 domain-containing protein n=1 Tax=Oryza punctata TaxID=4537 RepID=A0A0E0L8Y9_ORYPU